jgi:spermidine synthase
LPLYQLSTHDVRTIVATWCAAFEHTSAWLTAYDLALVGSRVPLAGEAATDALPWPPRVAASLAEAGIAGSPDLAALQVADDDALRAFAAGARPMTDDRPVLEFRAPLSFLSGYSVEVLRWAGRDAFLEQLPAASLPSAHATRDALAEFLDSLADGWSEAARRYGEALLAPTPTPAGD